MKEELKDKIGKFYTMRAATLEDGNVKDVLEMEVKERDINNATDI